jgi:chromosomal replication initiator protein
MSVALQTSGDALQTQGTQGLEWGPDVTLNWPAVQNALRQNVGADDYAAWLSEMQVQKAGPDGVVVTVPTSFVESWVKTNYLETLTTTIRAELGNRPVPVKLAVAPVFSIPAPKKVETAPVPVVAAAPVAVASASVQSVRLDPRYTFETFVVGGSNQFVFAAAQRVAANGGKGEAGYNPLFIHGGVGLGKTHLMHAMGWEMQARNPNLKLLYLTSEQFFNGFTRAMRERNSLPFKDLLRGADVLMVDDLQFLAGKDGTQEEFFHSFNELVNAGKQVIVSADKPPQELDNIEERLKSRLGSGLMVQVHAPQVETRLAILQAKAETCSVAIPEDVLGLLAGAIASNVRELEGALNRVAAASQLLGVPVDTDFARAQLADLFRLHSRVVTLDDIQREVANHFNIRVSDMHSPRRSREVARPRMVAMYLAKQLTTKSYPDIGRAFGGKDHTTIMHAVKTIPALMEKDPELAEHVRLLMQLLGGK